MTQKIQELNQQITQIKKQIQIIEQNNLSDQQNQTIQKIKRQIYSIEFDILRVESNRSNMIYSKTFEDMCEYLDSHSGIGRIFAESFMREIEKNIQLMKQLVMMEDQIIKIKQEIRMIEKDLKI